MRIFGLNRRIIRVLLSTQYAHMLEYRAEIALWALSGVLPFIMLSVWSGSDARSGLGLDGVALDRYFLSAFLVRQFSVVWVVYDFEEDALMGRLSPYLLHPLMPHLTEELWYSVTAEPESTFLALQPWPALDETALDDGLEASFAELIAAIRVVRNLRAVAGIKPSQSVPVRFVTGRGELAAVLTQGTGDITALTRAESVVVMAPAEADAAPVAKALAGVSGELQVLLPIEGLVDLDALKGRLEKDIAKAEKEIKGLAGRLGNPNFAGKAPPEVVAECRANLAEAEAQADLARKRLTDLMG